MEISYKVLMMVLFLLTAAIGCTYVSGKNRGEPRPYKRDRDVSNDAYQKTEYDRMLMKEIEEIEAMIETQKNETCAEASEENATQGNENPL